MGAGRSEVHAVPLYPAIGIDSGTENANIDPMSQRRSQALPQQLPLWQRLVITVLVMLGASYVAALIWNAVLGFALPSYIAGLVGGLAAIPVWDLLQRLRPKG